MKTNAERTPLIGTLKERTLHAALKSFYEPDPVFHEKRYKGYVADILRDDGIIEIQTRSFQTMRPKLRAFLPDKPVTVVYPAVQNKWLSWIDPATHQVEGHRRSPKKGIPLDAFQELYKIKMFLRDPNLNIHILMVDVDEYRYLNGWSQDKKKGSTRCERIPVGIGEKFCLHSSADYQRLLPDVLEDRFGSAELAAACHRTRSYAQTVLNIMTYVNAVEVIGKKGNAYVYRRAVLEE